MNTFFFLDAAGAGYHMHIFSIPSCSESEAHPTPVAQRDQSTELKPNHSWAITITANSLPLVITSQDAAPVSFDPFSHQAHLLLCLSLTDLIPPAAWFTALYPCVTSSPLHSSSESSWMHWLMASLPSWRDDDIRWDTERVISVIPGESLLFAVCIRVCIKLLGTIRHNPVPTQRCHSHVMSVS